MAVLDESPAGRTGGALDVTREEYEAEQARRREDKDGYPWFCYFMFGWHNMQYLSEKEAKETIRFYKLHKDGDTWQRYGRQPIYMSRRE